MISEEKREQENSKSSSSWPQNTPYVEREGQGKKVWGILLFGLIGATVTTFAVAQLRRTVDFFYTELTRSKGSTGGSFRSSFKGEAWKRYNRRLQEDYEEEMERVERIRRMQSVFNRERNKYKRSYERWRENDPGAYHQHFQRDDWYWTNDTSYKEQRANSRATPRESGNYSLSHHYSVLGLDREQNLTRTQRLRQLSEQRRWSTTQIKTGITKRLLKRSSKRCLCPMKPSNRRERMRSSNRQGVVEISYIHETTLEKGLRICYIPTFPFLDGDEVFRSRLSMFLVILG
ncbi:uncharacterized protein LOC122094438 isoform X1 [Macadamia integrifolia]|uniref:uncharacterized protein LOC122094438 isoform X1 n=1 Tax=Macadamia integrifolia TaxID=60698 RepID=UPI001C5021DA|nr:uncharacterized protein LOC122094438 isoform X1 [Macadamia integrifolia]